MAFKIYTKTGDLGMTGLYGGARLSKDDIRIEAYGTVDELNAAVALVEDYLPDSVDHLLSEIQNRLFTIGSNLASDPSKDMSVPDVMPVDVEALEKAIDKMEETLTPLQHFVLPGGHKAVSHTHMARTICRRAERRVISLSKITVVEPIIIQYLNRLSDYLFVLSRFIAKALKVSEKYWIPRSK